MGGRKWWPPNKVREERSVALTKPSEAALFVSVVQYPLPRYQMRSSPRLLSSSTLET